MTEYSLESLGWTPALMQSLDLDQETPGDVARISAVHRDSYEALTAMGRLRLRTMPPATPPGERPTVGDWIIIDAALERPCRVLPRRSLFARKAPGALAERQLIAANVDVAFLVSSCNHDFNPARLERYLSLTREAGAYPVILLTKADQTDEPGGFIGAAQAIASDCPIEALNALEPDETRRLRDWIGAHQTVACLGSSGVGKTTLLNALTGGSDAVAGIRNDDSKGRHTTRARSMHRLPGGGWAIDLPGMRELALAGTSDGVDATFADIVDLANDCRFRDCQHESEPGCAVSAAIRSGNLPESRLERFRKLQREIYRNNATLAEKRASDKALGKLYKNVQTARNARRDAE
ncbi:ribosome small subunit-dependent GTPase A [Hyphobacterium sp.]|uniref:ribosome small subunit-dependent GTPase A n=1 Tax=Hyphobacterium sp. TaxID=2004662 RepID=UPI003B51CD7A